VTGRSPAKDLPRLAREAICLSLIIPSVEPPPFRRRDISESIDSNKMGVQPVGTGLALSAVPAQMVIGSQITLREWTVLRQRWKGTRRSETDTFSRAITACAGETSSCSALADRASPVPMGYVDKAAFPICWSRWGKPCPYGLLRQWEIGDGTVSWRAFL
jgi:hypothetical protein